MGKIKSNEKKFFWRHAHVKGFVFTISVILFASTLIIYAQNFAEQSAKNEQTILTAYQIGAGKQLSDDIGYDIAHILGVSIDAKYYSSGVAGVKGVIVSVDGYTQQPYSVGTALSEYATFLTTSLFPLIGGEQHIDMSGLTNGTASLSLGKAFSFVQKYDSNNVALYSSQGTLQSLALDLFADHNLVGYTWTPTAGSVPITMRFVSDANYVLQTASINPAGTSTLLLRFADANVLVSIGAVDGKVSSVVIDSNSVARTRYHMDANYLYAGEGLPMDFNAILSHRALLVDTNTFIRYKD